MIRQFPFRPVAGDSKLTDQPGPTAAHQRGARLATPWMAVIAGALLHLPVAHAENFTPPGLEGFTQHSERDADGDGDGVNETHIMQYMNTNGDSLFSMTTRDRLWAWSLDTRDSDIGTDNYVIRDSDCDGSFDEVYALDQEYHVPDCLK
ncbi:MAG TPA: hypothetical protein VM011_04410 [Gammaproteobacteria bacterium]|nr:hypothetical protein [Gammaproteobacteria bacterium]